jgi:ribonuclease-3
MAESGSRAKVEEALGYEFKDPALFRQALLHRSYTAEHPNVQSYERLEFLGDAVLQLAITDYLFTEYPELAEGELAKVRAAVVNEATLAVLARRFGLGNALLLGRGEELTGGRNKDSLLSDVVEAMLGVVYLEAGFGEARRLVLRHWSDLVDERAASPGRRDYKTRLQEVLARRASLPRYVIEETGPEHAKEFAASVWSGDELLGVGSGTSKKRAEQDAAHAAFRRLEAAEHTDGGDA